MYSVVLLFLPFPSLLLSFSGLANRQPRRNSENFDTWIDNTPSRTLGSAMRANDDISGRTISNWTAAKPYPSQLDILVPSSILPKP